MNKERMLLVADAIEKNAKNFNMKTWFADPGGGSDHSTYNKIQSQGDKMCCGMTACIGGWTVLLFGSLYLSIEFSAKDQLGLTPTQASFLFYYQGDHNCRDDVTAEEAAQVIRDMVSGKLEIE